MTEPIRFDAVAGSGDNSNHGDFGMGGGVYREGLYGGGQHAVADNEASDAEFEGTGKASGESMQYKLEGLLNLRALGVGVEVSRTASWDGAGRGTNEWKVTFVHERGEVPGAIGHADARSRCSSILRSRRVDMARELAFDGRAAAPGDRKSVV